MGFRQSVQVEAEINQRDSILKIDGAKLAKQYWRGSLQNRRFHDCVRFIPFVLSFRGLHFSFVLPFFVLFIFLLSFPYFVVCLFFFFFCCCLVFLFFFPCFFVLFCFSLFLFCLFLACDSPYFLPYFLSFHSVAVLSLFLLFFLYCVFYISILISFNSFYHCSFLDFFHSFCSCLVCLLSFLLPCVFLSFISVNEVHVFDVLKVSVNIRQEHNELISLDKNSFSKCLL